MTVYRSKVDLWLMVVVFVPFIWAIIESINSSEHDGLGVMLVILAAVVLLLIQIRYIIKDNILEVKSGFLGTQRINIQDIRSVTKTYNPLSAPALSINRLEVKYGNNFDYVLISPKRREEFINDLKAVNPNIEVRI